MIIPGRKEFLRGLQEYKTHEKRDAMYKVATFLIDHFWGKPSEMADGLGVLLLTWNQTFYRYGIFDFDKLENAIIDNFVSIKEYRNRDIFSFSSYDVEDIEHLFIQFLEALSITTNSGQVKKGYVSTAKALHLLAPKYFPIWDKKISVAYCLDYQKNPTKEYVTFCEITKSIAESVKEYTTQSNKTLIKLIDEYNYSKYSKNWI